MILQNNSTDNTSHHPYPATIQRCRLMPKKVPETPKQALLPPSKRTCPPLHGSPTHKDLVNTSTHNNTSIIICTTLIHPHCTYIQTSDRALYIHAMILAAYSVMQGTAALTSSKPPRPPILHYHNHTVYFPSRTEKTESNYYSTLTGNPLRATTHRSSTPSLEGLHGRATSTCITSARMTHAGPTRYPHTSKQDYMSPLTHPITEHVNLPTSFPTSFPLRILQTSIATSPPILPTHPLSNWVLHEIPTHLHKNTQDSILNSPR
jgi:hypothetical protein